MNNSIKKLAKIILVAGHEIATNRINKCFNIGNALGIFDSNDVILVRDYEGYRSICIGNLVDGSKPYMYLYFEQCDYDEDKRVWEYCCFPDLKSLEQRLQKVLEIKFLSPLDKNNFGFEDYYYSCRSLEAMKYYASVVKRFANSAENDSRGADEIVGDLRVWCRERRKSV